jgi:NAD(P)-dependent dehydrogenase (short-subunit alcohol dehydrogenase family)
LKSAAGSRAPALSVILAARDAAKAKRRRARCAKKDTEVEFRKLDVTDADSIKTFAAELGARRARRRAGEQRGHHDRSARVALCSIRRRDLPAHL